VLKLRKVELLGFKSFLEKTPITFSGSGITCIIGPNGCGKSNVVDAISWVLGEQSHKSLRAERMSDCIFNGTARRPPMGLAEVTLTLVDPELAEAVAKVIDGESASTSDPAGPVAEDASSAAPSSDGDPLEISTSEAAEESAEDPTRARKYSPDKPAIRLRPGEIVVGRRLYRSGQSEYLINGRVARLRDVQEIFMGMGLGPNSYAIIEQGRIGQILNSRPMDRRAIIEEAAGVTMYKTKRRLAEAKLEASKINLSRVNDILVEVEKQLASLKRQASKARRYAELREQMRALLGTVLASKAQHLDNEAARLEALLRQMDAAEEGASQSVRELESEQERLSARSYELDSELRRTLNLLNQAALDLDRAENRIAFNREQSAQLATRAAQLSVEIEQARAQASDLAARLAAQQSSLAALRSQAELLESALRQSAGEVTASSSEQERLEARASELALLASRLAEQSAHARAESSQAEELAARHAAAEEQCAAALTAVERNCAALEEGADIADASHTQAEERVQQAATAVRDAQARLGDLRQSREETSRQLERTREALSGERARHASLERLLRERAYTADAVQKLFTMNGQGEARGFRAVGLLADYAEVQEEYEAAIEQFLRDELEYVVVETFDHARAGVSLLRDEVGGRATFFVDSLSNLDTSAVEAAPEDSLAGRTLARLDRLVEFRSPLGDAAKRFLSRLRDAYLVESPSAAEQLACEYPRSYFLTSDGTCYYGRMVSGGRKSDAGPLALKRELRHHESEAARLDQTARAEQSSLTRLEEEIAAAESDLARVSAQQMEAEKSLVSAAHARDHARAELARVALEVAAERAEIDRLRAEAAVARDRAALAREAHADAIRSRAAAEAEAAATTERLAALRRDYHGLQEQVAARREELAAVAERLAAAEAVERRLADEIAQSEDRRRVLGEQHAALLQEQAALESSSAQLAQQMASLRSEKGRLEEQKAALETEWEQARTRTAEIDEALRARRQSLDELRAERNQHQIERARNDADRDHLRQTCLADLNAQPEDLIVQQAELLAGETLIAAETQYNEMKARVEAMGPVNMMALEEFKECEQREGFLRRERDDLVQSIENTQLTITELDQVSRQKFEEAFRFVNTHFAIAFQSLFGGGHGEMRLSEPDSSGESGIDIVAQPPGKRLQNILLLSGGEKALAALALLIAIFRYRPSPFCILDEVDAPLDEANVGRFNRMLDDMSGQTQFIVVTHNRKTMEMGSVLYGVTMQEPGVSKLVSVKWEDVGNAAQPKAAHAASNAA